MSLVKTAVPRRPLAPVLLGTLLVSTLACQASVQSNVEVQVQANTVEIQDFDKPLEAPPLEIAKAENEFSLAEFALLGARHDLQYTGATEATCRCLAVSLQDRANHPSFKWEVQAPRLEPTTQFVIAVSSADLDCTRAPKDSQGASYQGYEVRGNDVIVMIEPLTQGRPPTQGAVIPKPLGGGHVFIQASGSVYGKPLAGRGKRCKLGSPSSDSGATASR